MCMQIEVVVEDGLHSLREDAAVNPEGGGPPMEEPLQVTYLHILPPLWYSEPPHAHTCARAPQLPLHLSLGESWHLAFGYSGCLCKGRAQGLPGMARQGTACRLLSRV